MFYPMMGYRSAASACFVAALCSLAASCGSGKKSPSAAPTEPVASAEPRLAAVATFLEGAPVLRRAGADTVLRVGDALAEGDVLATDASSWIEIEIGSSSTIRVLPGTTASLRALRDASADHEWKSTELGLDAGSILAKVSKLAGRDEFIVVTPHTAAGVRGTAFSVSAEPEAARIAVRSGSVAVLPKGPLLEGLLDGRRTNPIAGAVVRAAFAFAPRVEAGSELAVDSAAGIEAAEAAYGELLVAAEKSTSAGIVLDDADDPRPFLAPDGSAAADRLRSVLGAYAPRAASGSSIELLRLLDALRDPAVGYEAYPAALPAARAEAGPKPPAPNPAVLWTVVVTKARFVDALTRVADRPVAADAAGTVYAVSPDGAVSWSVKGSALGVTALGESVAVSSSDGLSLLDGATGELRGAYPFDFTPAASNAKPVAVPQGLAVVVPRGIALLRAENASLIREIPVEGGVAASPVLADRELVCVTGKGELAFLDLSGGAGGASVPIGLGGEPFAPRYRDGRVFVADRSGRVVAVSAAERSVLWTRDLGSPVGSELEVGDAKVYAWTTDRRVHPLSLADGSASGAPIPGVSAPPLLSGGKLYWGTASGELVAADAATGSVLKRIPVGRAVGVRPIMVGGVLYAGTADGRIVKIDPNR
jgi:outer membrane protein assembly factor BamB